MFYKLRQYKLIHNT